MLVCSQTSDWLQRLEFDVPGKEGGGAERLDPPGPPPLGLLQGQGDAGRGRDPLGSSVSARDGDTAARAEALRDALADARAGEEKGRIRVPSKHFSSIDVGRLKTQLEWSQLAAWRQELSLCLKGYSDAAFELLATPVEAYEAYRAVEYPRDVAQVDTWAAQQLVATLDVDSQRAKWVLRSLRAQPTGVRTSVVRTMAAVLTAIKRNPESEERAKAEFEGRTFFRQGDEEERTMVGASALRDEYEALPEEARLARHGLFRAFLRHMPEGAVRLRDDWRARLVESEVTGVALPWTYDQLSMLLAQYLQSTGSALAHNAEVSYAGGAPAGGRSSRELVCDNCGQKGHMAKFCKRSCSECKEKSCPGARGARCVVRSHRPVTVLKGASGKDVPPFVLKIIQSAQAKWLSKNPSRAHAAEAGEPPQLLCSEDQWGDEEEMTPEACAAQAYEQEFNAERAADNQRDILERVLMAGAVKPAAGEQCDE